MHDATAPAATVEELNEAISALVRERQELRASGGARELLERNRLRLVRAQQELARGLIARYLPLPQ